MTDAVTLNGGGPTGRRRPAIHGPQAPRRAAEPRAAAGAAGPGRGRQRMARGTFDIATQKCGRRTLIATRQAGAVRQAHSGLRRPRFRPPHVLG